ncbi:MAG: Ni/Fe hydrogenase subunit alpha [Chloroflexi bacterium]|nr:Ni/Fe hydrogenase subunit alpha [Chloroflexota bacterium]
MSARRHITSARSGAQPKKINVDYFARTEGEGGLHAVLSDHKLESFTLDVWEPPRFFEGFLAGRLYHEVPDLVSRICGICPVSHHETALKAIERAIGLKVDGNTGNVRRLIAWSQILASHIIHLYMLALPDYLGYDGLISMLPDYPDEAQRFLRMKTAVNNVTDAIGGRALHTNTSVVGGFTRPTARRRMIELREALKAIKQDSVEMAHLFGGLSYPDFQTDATYVSLVHDAEYPVDAGMIGSNTGLRIPVEEYRSHFREWQVPTANTKYTGLDGDNAVRVGAISRVNLNFDLLSPDTKAVAKEIGYSAPDDNPYHNNLAQALEVVNGIDGCIELIDQVDTEVLGIAKYDIHPGEGVWMTEAPRGSLYHKYRVNSEGVVEAADIVTPTAHQVYNMDKELRELILAHADEDADEITFKAEELVRAYDPCFSCSVHIIKANNSGMDAPRPYAT